MLAAESCSWPDQSLPSRVAPSSRMKEPFCERRELRNRALRRSTHQHRVLDARNDGVPELFRLAEAHLAARGSVSRGMNHRQSLCLITGNSAARRITSRARSGRRSIIGVRKSAGASVIVRMPNQARSLCRINADEPSRRARRLVNAPGHRQAHAHHAALGRRVGDLACLSLERGCTRRVDAARVSVSYLSLPHPESD